MEEVEEEEEVGGEVVIEEEVEVAIEVELVIVEEAIEEEEWVSGECICFLLSCNKCILLTISEEQFVEVDTILINENILN